MKKKLILLILFILNLPYVYARFGGGGGRRSRGGGSHHSSGGHSYGGGGFHSYGSGSGGSSGGLSGFSLIIIIIIGVIIYFYLKSKYPSLFGGNSQNNNDYDNTPVQHFASQNFPDGLDQNKLSVAFTEMQNAWQQKNVQNVRKWMSDGMYQRLHTQFHIMDLLGQRNRLSNLNIEEIRVIDNRKDGEYDVVDVEFSFSVDDDFISDKYPQFNESYPNDYVTEYWTFIRKQGVNGHDLYQSKNCPNCGDVLDENLGEVSRCKSCKTLTNNATYDWILCEITQEDDYDNQQPLLHDSQLWSLVKNDPDFAIQKMEDLASNIFMQIMEVFSGGDPKKLSKFADEKMVQKLNTIKQNYNNILFNRLFLNQVTLENYVLGENQILNLSLSVTATYSKVMLQNGKLSQLEDFETEDFQLVLSRSIYAKLPNEISYSHECPSCAAPYDDTTADTCSYCGSPVVDAGKIWVLTDFE